jgi:hypothetical protein
MKTLVNIYSAVTGRIKYLHDVGLTQWLHNARANGRSLNYHIKK